MALFGAFSLTGVEAYGSVGLSGYSLWLGKCEERLGNLPLFSPDCGLFVSPISSWNIHLPCGLSLFSPLTHSSSLPLEFLERWRHSIAVAGKITVFNRLILSEYIE